MKTISIEVPDHIYDLFEWLSKQEEFSPQWVLCDSLRAFFMQYIEYLRTQKPKKFQEVIKHHRPMLEKVARPLSLELKDN